MQKHENKLKELTEKILSAHPVTLFAKCNNLCERQVCYHGFVTGVDQCGIKFVRTQYHKYDTKPAESEFSKEFGEAYYRLVKFVQRNWRYKSVATNALNCVITKVLKEKYDPSKYPLNTIIKLEINNRIYWFKTAQQGYGFYWEDYILPETEIISLEIKG